MSDDFLGERRKALEDSFFAKQNQKLMEEMQARKQAETQRQALEVASGIHDEAVLEALVAAGISPETLAALSLVPLVAVAWADGKLDSRERSALLDAAAEAGLPRDGVAHRLLESWLAERPSSEVLETWKAYIGALRETLDSVVLAGLRQELLDLARRVAQASGGLLRGNVSKEEESVLAELEATFS